jgi:hypothetical protein
MLAEHDAEWMEEYKKGLELGREEALRKALRRSRGVILQDLEKRFGPLPEEIRRQIDAIGSIEEMIELSFRAGAASSLEDLELS